MSRSPLRLTLLFLGKTKQDYLAAGIEDFRQRLGRYVEVAIVLVKEKRFSAKYPTENMIREEGELLLAQVPERGGVVALDPSGRQISSTELAGLVSEWEGQGRGQMTFVIGGALGLSGAVLARADLVLSLSRLTFTHEMARFILLEQLYRAFTIKAGTGYHK